MAYIITLGNEKGGSGKSTTAMHIFAAAAHSGYKVGVIDLDLRQKSFLRYVENRRDTVESTKIRLPLPEYVVMHEGEHDSIAQNRLDEEAKFTEALRKLEEKNDLVIIDCPGANTNYANMAHAVADTLITPMNESFVDFDLLARVDPVSGKIKGPSVYAEMVWDARNLRHRAGLAAIDWVVIRNRMSSRDAKNRRQVSSKLKEFSQRIGFRVAAGFSERVIFRELFVKGLTLLDLPMMGKGSLNVSNIAARQEVRDLLKNLRLKDFTFDV